VPLCKGGAGVRRFSGPAREGLLLNAMPGGGHTLAGPVFIIIMHFILLPTRPFVYCSYLYVSWFAGFTPTLSTMRLQADKIFPLTCGTTT